MNRNYILDSGGRSGRIGVCREKILSKWGLPC